MPYLEDVDKELKKYLTPDQLTKCAEIQSQTSTEKPLAIVAVEQGYIDSKTLTEIVNKISFHGVVHDYSEALLLIGTKIGDYQITKVLVEGGIGDIYEVVDISQSNFRALKLIKATCGIKQFDQQFEIARTLKHPYLIEIYETGTITDNTRSYPYTNSIRPYFFMELIEESLEMQMDKAKTVTLDKGLTILKHVAMGLKYAHKNNIIHYDINPDNILFTRDKENNCIYKINIARPDTQPKNSTFSSGAVVMDTKPKYMAPEMVEGVGSDPRSNIFSLGIVAYEIFTGQEPFSADRSMDYLFANFKKIAPLPHEVKSDLPKPLSAMITRMMAKEIKNRYQACELLSDIDRVSDHFKNGIELYTEDQTSAFYQKGQLVKKKTPQEQFLEHYDFSIILEIQAARKQLVETVKEDITLWTKQFRIFVSFIKDPSIEENQGFIQKVKSYFVRNQKVKTSVYKNSDITVSMSELSTNIFNSYKKDTLGEPRDLSDEDYIIALKEEAKRQISNKYQDQLAKVFEMRNHL